jgi:integrase
VEFTREALAKIGAKDITRVWKSRAPNARHTLTDGRCAGFMLITGATSQTWSVDYRPRGVNPATGERFPMKRYTIGTPATHSPDEALAKALQVKGLAKIGADPAAERQAAIVDAALQRARTVERAAADYLEALPANQKKGGGRISQAWAKEQGAHLRRAIAELGVASSPLASIDVKIVRKLRRGESYRHRFGSLSRFLDWCVHENLVPINVCASIGRAFRPKAGGRRERTPSLKDLALIWAAAETALEETFRDFMRFAICIPARRNEIANLRWEHLDLEARVWRQPGRLTKNRDPHEFYLHELALEILIKRWEAAGRPKAGLVFPSPRSATPVTAFSGMLRALHRALVAEDGTPTVEQWALHDLRRAFASSLGQLGEDDDATIDAVLNHRQSASRGGVLGTYNRSVRLPAQYEALERWGSLVADALEGCFPERPR